MKQPTITNIRGLQQPNPAYFGFKWRELQKLLGEAAELHDKARQTGREWHEAGEEIKRLEGELPRQRAAALRGGPEPNEGPLEAMRQHREALSERLQDYRRAGEMVDEDIRRVLALRGEAWDREVQARAERVLAEAQEIAERLSTKLSEADALAGIHNWLTSGGQVYTPGSPSAVSIEHLLYQRRRELGLTEVEEVIA